MSHNSHTFLHTLSRCSTLPGSESVQGTGACHTILTFLPYTCPPPAWEEQGRVTHFSHFPHVPPCCSTTPGSEAPPQVMGHSQSASSFPAGSTVKAQLRMAAGAYHWDDVVHKVKGKGVGKV